MKCKECGGEFKVSSTAGDDHAVYRRRVCLNCGAVTFTRETEYADARIHLSFLRGGHNARRDYR